MTVSFADLPKTDPKVTAVYSYARYVDTARKVLIKAYVW